METNYLNNRKCHTLVLNKAREAPKNVIFFDTETTETLLSPTRKSLSLKLGHAILTRRYPKKGYVSKDTCDFYARKEFYQWIDKVCIGKEKYYFVAHNIAFDVRVTGIMKYLTKSKWDRKSFILDKLNFMATYKRDKTTIMLMNNQQMFNVSLRDLGTSLGYDKLTVDFDSVTDSELMIYCRRDVDIMRVAWNAWYEYIQSNDLGNFKLTVGSQAFSAFRHRFMKDKIYIHNHEKAINLERESYHGGRVECFFIGTYRDGDVYNVDINSMYPYIMATRPIPTRLIKYYEQCPIQVFEKYRKKYFYIAQAQVHTSKPILPAVKDGRLVFQTGEIRGVFSKPELERAISSGTLRGVSRVAFYDEKIVFKEFVDFFYKSRKQFKREGNLQFAYISKILMNSLYGKFGQKITEYKATAYNERLPDHAGYTFDMVAGKHIKFRCIDGIIEIETGEHEAHDSFVAIASAITSHARSYLIELIETANWDNVLYCDTDSLFVNKEGYDNLSQYLNKQTIGMLKLEAMSDKVTIQGNKRYRFGDKVRNKGIRANAIYKGHNTYEQIQFQGFLGALRDNGLDSVVIDTVRKTLSNQYTKGIVTPSGKVIPFSVTS